MSLVCSRPTQEVCQRPVTTVIVLPSGKRVLAPLVGWGVCEWHRAAHLAEVRSLFSDDEILVVNLHDLESVDGGGS